MTYREGSPDDCGWKGLNGARSAARTPMGGDTADEAVMVQ